MSNRRNLTDAHGYRVGQPILMLIPTAGEDDNDQEIVLEPGNIGIIVLIEQLPAPKGIAFHVEINGQITNVFDETDRVDGELPFRAVDFSEADLCDADAFIAAAESHGASSDPDHEVGDLQDLVRAAFRIMTLEQKRQFFFDSEVQAVLVSGNKIDPEL